MRLNKYTITNAMGSIIISAGRIIEGFIPTIEVIKLFIIAASMMLRRKRRLKLIKTNCGTRFSFSTWFSISTVNFLSES